ncbi:sugar-binding transcriptional regulator [Defluviitalea phaphyphila]|uniref:sugar-binding transcriptional regulator n=1 Tax=Defluviitalea phaphyphila TaxID=1473580 RepID=UPI00072FFADA|nr:sugar-binding domain-containing protein [Defluviitalea phaphyphila]
MRNLLATLQKIIPDGILGLERRYKILKTIMYSEPIGRRVLSANLNISERIIRSETDFLKKNGFIKVSCLGMEITLEGKNIVCNLENLIHELKGFSELEKKVAKILDIPKVVIVLGDADKDEIVKKDIGKATARIFENIIQENSTIALTGGTTVSNIIEAIKTNNTYENAFVLPARGSIGNKVEYQSNTLTSQLAQKLGAKYRLLNIPDNLSKKSLESISKEPEIQDILKKVSKTDILIFGIGNAIKMARRRKVPEAILDFLKRKQAVGEAFGYYFNSEGEIVYASRSIGIRLEDIKKIPYKIAAAGGKSKAEAIKSIRHLLKDGCIVIDEGAANEIIKDFKD